MQNDVRYSEYCPHCRQKGEPTEEGFAEYECGNGHMWLVGGPL